MKLPKNIWTWVALLVAVGGIAVSVLSYAHNQSVVSGEFCTIGEDFNCDIVNRGPYSKIAGFPVSLIGVLGYSFLVLATILKLRTPSDRQLTLVMLAASAGAMAFSLYLTSLEAFVLHTWCVLCLTSQTLIAIFFVISGTLVYGERKQINGSPASSETN